MKTILMLLAMLLARCGLARADDPDPQAVLTEARELTRQGKFEEALQKFVWFYDNAVRIQPGMSGVRQSFALSYWTELGELYPKARETLVAIRDKNVEAIKAGKGTADLFNDVASINGYLDENSKTVELFKFIDAENPKLAQKCFYYVESILAESHEYTLYSKYIPDASQRLRYSINAYKLTKNFENNQPKNAAFPIPKYADSSFVENTRQLIEVLVNVGRKADAETVQKEAIAVLDDPEIRSAIEDAEKAKKPK